MATTGSATPPGNFPTLFECYVNVPHPAASQSCSPLSAIAAPNSAVDDHLLSQIRSFCFPEYEEGRAQPVKTSPSLSSSSKPQQPPTQPQRTTAEFKTMYLNRYDQYAMQPKSFTSFTFTLQLQDGRRLYGHVRRTLPLHSRAQTRYDVGRRGERALVLLTKTAGAGQLYQAILKSVDALASLNMALRPSQRKVKEPEKLFLHALYREQQRMADHYQRSPADQRGKPLIAALSGLEVQETTLYGRHDINRFMVPTCLLHNKADSSNNLPTGDTTSSLLPLLRCVGVAHALRIFAALLSERRIILTSSSPTRLSACSHAALAMLHCGLLHWQHLYIPVLPPHLWQYLAAPYPYLIGIVDSAVPKLDLTDGLGEVLLVNLDANSMETRNIPQNVVAQRLPDLFSAADPSYYSENGGSPRNEKDLTPSASEFLAQDLLELLKTDKKTLYGEVSAYANIGETAGKAAKVAGKAIKAGFGKLKARLKGQSSNVSEEEDKEEAEQEQSPVMEGSSLADDYIFTEGCHNEVAEQQARLAFACFFLALVGNMRWYLNSPGQGQTPVLDRQRFLEQKRLAGDGQGSALWPLLQNFCQTQMLEEFAKARVEEVRSGAEAPADSPLFAQCAQYHRRHNLDFSVQSVRNVAGQVAKANPGRLTGLLQTNARRMAMSLTSNKNFEGDYPRATAQLVEQCRESSSVLFDVMSVIWLRIRDSKGLNWKHGYLALQLLKDLLYYGPLAAVVDATDGLEKIRTLRSYQHMRNGVAQDMRKSATLVYKLLVDRAKLWAVRRLSVEQRRMPADKRMKLVKMDRVVNPTHPIDFVHNTFHPLARPTIAPVPPRAQSNTGIPQQYMPGQQQPAQPPPTTNVDDIFGIGTVSAPPAVPQANNTVINADLMGLFDDMALSPAPAVAAPVAEPAFVAQPTIVALPPKPADAGPSVTPIQDPTTAPAPQSAAPAQQQPFFGGALASQPTQQQAWGQTAPSQLAPQWPAAGQVQPQAHPPQPSPFEVAQHQQQFMQQQHQPQGYYQQGQPSPQQFGHPTTPAPAQQPQQTFGHAQQQHQQAQANLFAVQQQQHPPHQQQPGAAPSNPFQYDPFAGI